MADILKQVILSDDFFYFEKPNSIEGNDLINTNHSPFPPEDYGLLKEQALDEGYKIGFEQGITDGLEQGQKLANDKILEVVQQLKNILQTIPDAINESRLALKTDIADIVLAISKQFFIQQQCSKEAITQQITTALTHLNNEQKITLALNPQDLILLRQGTLKIDFRQYKELQVIADDTLSLGGCRIKTEHGMFDASIERQIDCLKHALLQIKKSSS